MGLTVYTRKNSDRPLQHIDQFFINDILPSILTAVTVNNNMMDYHEGTRCPLGQSGVDPSLDKERSGYLSRSKLAFCF